MLSGAAVSEQTPAAGLLRNQGLASAWRKGGATFDAALLLHVKGDALWTPQVSEAATSHESDSNVRGNRSRVRAASRAAPVLSDSLLRLGAGSAAGSQARLHRSGSRHSGGNHMPLTHVVIPGALHLTLEVAGIAACSLAGAQEPSNSASTWLASRSWRG